MTEHTLNQNSTQTMSDHGSTLLAGAIVEASVISVEANQVTVEFGYKQLGHIAVKDWSDVRSQTLVGTVNIGERVLARITELHDEGEHPVLSRKDAVSSDTWATLQDKFASQEIIEVKILAAIKGGLVADIESLRAFLPASLVDFRFQSDLTSFVGQTVPVVITEIDPEQRRVIISRKQALEKEQQSFRGEKLQAFEVGQITEGIVARLTGFGAFVDLGGIDGLLHISEMSFARVNRPEDVVQPGDSVRVKILRIEPESGKISLSMKLEDANPWRSATNQFQVGQVITGVVKRIASFGAFVEVAPGIEGLVHISQLANSRIESPVEVVTPGDEVQVKILELKPEEERMSLSIREATKQSQKPAPAMRQPSKTEMKAEPTSATLEELFGEALRKKFNL